MAEWVMNPPANMPWHRHNTSKPNGTGRTSGHSYREQFHPPGAGPKLPTPQGQQTGACTVTQVASCYPTIYPNSRPHTGKAAAQALGCTGDAVGRGGGERRAGQEVRQPTSHPTQRPLALHELILAL